MAGMKGSPDKNILWDEFAHLFKRREIPETDQPSLYSIESIEPCVIHVITRKDYQHMLEMSVLVKKQVEDSLFQRLLFYQKLFLSRIKDSPEERYRELLASNPEILKRVPQHYIASFLGITPVSLSRIRNRR